MIITSVENILYTNVSHITEWQLETGLWEKKDTQLMTPFLPSLPGTAPFSPCLFSAAFVSGVVQTVTIINWEDLYLLSISGLDFK